MVCGVGAVDGEYYPYPPYQTISLSKYHNVTRPCAMLLVRGTKKKRRPHFNLGTLPHNAVCCVASIHDSILWTRGPNSWVLTRVDNRASATPTKTFALAGRTTGRPLSTFLKTLATAVVSRRNTSQMGQNVFHDHPFTVHSLCLFLIKSGSPDMSKPSLYSFFTFTEPSISSPTCLLISPRFSLRWSP
jgi:hypothetical protein